MTQNASIDLARLGILALPISGLLLLISALTQIPAPDHSTIGNQGAAQHTNATISLIGNYSYLAGLVLAALGVFALFVYLYSTNGAAVGDLVLIAMITSVFGIALFLPNTAGGAFVAPVLGQSYLADQQNAFDVREAFLAGPARFIDVSAASLYSVGSILFGVACWRTGTLAKKWGAISYAIGGPLASLPVFGLVLSVVGVALMLLGAGGIAFGVLRGTQDAPSQAIG